MALTANVRDGYYVRWEVLVDGLTHSHEIHVEVQGTPAIGDPANSIDLLNRDSTTQTLAVWVGAFIAVLEPVYGSVATITNFELWFAPEGTTDYQWITNVNASGVGTNGAIYQPAQHNIMTFRTRKGGLMRFSLLEANQPGDTKVPLGVVGAPMGNIRDFLLSATSPVQGVDDGYLIAPLFLGNGQHEVVWRKRYR